MSQNSIYVCGALHFSAKSFSISCPLTALYITPVLLRLSLRLHTGQMLFTRICLNDLQDSECAI